MVLTKYHQLSGFNNRFVSHGSAGCEFKIKALADQCLVSAFWVGDSYLLAGSLRAGLRKGSVLFLL